ncbi:MAG: hypothetical protein K6A30_04555, partial [Lachnospiraceae bacterium]|nr:hypothetical protein [Lachnospiraceae bacterium]
MVLGEEEFSFPVHRKVRLQYYKEFMQELPAPFHAAIVNRKIQRGELPYLMKAIKAHTLFFTENVDLGINETKLMKSKKGKVLSNGQLQQLLGRDIKFFFLGSNGNKLQPSDLEISRNYKGKVVRYGNYNVKLFG